MRGGWFDALEMRARKMRISQRENKSVRVAAFVVMLATLLIAAWPVFRSGVYVKGDLAFHLGRIESLYLGIKNGVFPLKVHFSLANEYGYGEGFFYPDALLYFPAVLRLFGASLECSYKAYVIGIILAAWGSMFLSLRRVLYADNVLLAACGASVYVLSFRFMHSIYEYGSVGTYTAMAFMPMAIGGLLRILYQEYRRRDLVWMTAGTALTVLSHSTSAIMTIAFMALLFLLSLPQVDRKRLCHLLVCAACGVLATIGYWLPALEQVCDQKFYLHTQPAILLTDNILGLGDVLRFSGVAELCVLALIAVLLARSLVRAARQREKLHGKVQEERITCCRVDKGTGEDRNRPMEMRRLHVTGWVTIIFCTAVYCAPLWKLIGARVQFVQSPTRLLGTACAGVSFSLCFALEEGMERGRRARHAGYVLGLVMAGVFAVQATVQMRAFTATVPADSIDYAGIVGLGAGTEWLPDGGSHYAIDETERAIDPEGEGAYGVKYGDGKYLDVYIRMDREFYDMPYFYYKGYAAYLLDDAGNPVQELEVVKAPKERHAYVRVLLPEGGSGIGHVMVIYRKTLLQKLAYLVNAAFLGGYAVVGVWRSIMGSRSEQRPCG